MKFDRVYIEISNICNLQCDFCPEVLRSKNVMSLELFRHIIDQVKDLTNEVTFHVMGEPLNHPHFAEFVDYCAERSVAINLTTNGTLLGSEALRATLMKPAIRQINFSLQSLTAQSKAQSEGDLVRLRDRYLGRIFEFTRAAFVARPDLYINFRLWNMGTVEATAKENSFFLEPIEREFNFKLTSPVDVAFRKSRFITNRLYMHFDSRFEWPTLDAGVRQTVGFCQALKNHFAVLADGTVVPCCLDKEAKITLGRLGVDNQCEPIDQILKSKRARDLRLGFDRGEVCENLCQRCQYIERFEGKAQKLRDRHQGHQLGLPSTLP